MKISEQAKAFMDTRNNKNLHRDLVSSFHLCNCFSSTASRVFLCMNCGSIEKRHWSGKAEIIWVLHYY